MSDLERRLEALRQEIAWPATPAFRPALDRRPARIMRPRVLVFVSLIVLVVAAGVLALSPGARSAFLEVFRIRGATVERVERLPDTPLRRLDLGQRVSRSEAERRVGFELVEVGSPDSVYVRDDRVVTIVYGSPEKARLLLTELRGGVWDGLVQKAGGGGTSVERVEIGGEPGLFVSGDDHWVAFLDASGAIRGEQTYLAGTVLLWNRGPLLLRLEGDLTRTQAVELAESIE